MSELSKSLASLARQLVAVGVMGAASSFSVQAASQQVLKVGIEATYPPMSYRDPATNQSVGFNIDLLEALAKELGVELKFQEMSFEQLTAGLQTDRIDVIGTAITDLPARRATMTFVDYLQTGAQMFTTAKNQDLGDTPDAFCGQAIGAPRTANYFPELNAWNDQHCIAAGKPAATIHGTSGAAALRLDLQQGRLNAGVLGPEYVTYLMGQEPGNYQMLGHPLAMHRFGFAFSKTNTSVRDDLVKALDALIANGTYTTVLKRWKLEGQAINKATIDGGQ